MANQTIIKAAGQRYAPTKTDYSGYIQGIASVATALIEKTKSTNKNQAALNKLLKGVQTDITPYGDLMKNYINYHSDSIETKQIRVEEFKKQTLRFEDLQTNMGEKIDAGLTNSLDPDVENYMRAFAQGDFDETFSVPQPVYNQDGVQIGTKMQEFNMKFITDENFRNLRIIGPKGEYITLDEFENLLNVPSKTDGDKITVLLEKFPTDTGVKMRNDGIRPPTEVFDATRDEYLGEINRLLENGDGDISGDSVTTAFMFDSFITKDGKKTNFLDWYLSKPYLFPEGFSELYAEYEVEYALGGETKEKMLNIIAQDLIKNDPNVKEDLMEYINSIFEQSRGN